MNVRVRLRGFLDKTLLFGGVTVVRSDGQYLWLDPATSPELLGRFPPMPMRAVEELLLDEEPGDLW